jgi:site-specific DNA-cytosine methylase
MDEHMPRRMKQPSALGMEIYHGSFTLGVKRAGFKVRGHLESTNYAVKSAQLNHPDIDIRYNHEYGNLSDFFLTDLIYSNPPCAIWSSASSHFTEGRDGFLGKEAWRTDVRLDLHLEIHANAQSLQPKAFVIESITNAWQHGRVFWEERARDWAKYGYSITVLLDNNMYLSHTSPQNRRRIFFIAHKYPLHFPDFVYPRTTGEILEEDVPPVPEERKRWLKPFMTQLWEKSAQYSGSLTRVLREGDVEIPHGEHAPSFLCRRAKWNEVPNVYMSDSTRLHPTEPRYYDRSEVLGICGMPQDWKAAVAWSGESMEMARCVLPGAGEYVATAVYQGLQDRPLRHAEHVIYNWIDAYNPTTELFFF